MKPPTGRGQKVAELPAKQEEKEIKEKMKRKLGKTSASGNRGLELLAPRVRLRGVVSCEAMRPVGFHLQRSTSRAVNQQRSYGLQSTEGVYYK